MINRALFFPSVKSVLFGGRFTQNQVDGMDSMFDAWEATPQPTVHGLAYELATAFHETARTMAPICEYGLGQGHPYGEADPETGQIYYGRGLVQLTWRRNYATAGTKLGLDLVHDPDLALVPANAARILHRGMAEGWFTGRRLGDYFSVDHADPMGARKIINGQDCAGIITSYYRSFLPAVANAAGVKLH